MRDAYNDATSRGCRRVLAEVDRGASRKAIPELLD
jgi:hypothetical protein